VRGLIETAAQFIEPTEPIGGFGTIRIEPGVFVTFTHRLVIAGTSRDLVADTVERLTSGKGQSLADRDEIQELKQQRDDGLVFAYVDVKSALAAVNKVARHDQDVMQVVGMAYGMLDAAHMRSLSASVGSSPEGFFTEFRMLLDEGHANFAYNLIRTPPMTGRSLKCVPAGAAVVVSMGINPASSPEDAQLAASKADSLRYVTGLDLGRELFANIEEIALFAVPGERHTGGLEIPDVGLVIAAADPVKSQHLWDYLLTIPSKVMGHEFPEPISEQIAGTDVRVYPMPEGVTIRIAQIDHSVIVAPTKAAMAAAVETFRSGKSILTDPAVKAATGQITDETSIVLFAHAGRCAQIGAQFCPPEEMPIVRMVGDALGSMMLTAVIDESATRLRVAANLTGLPKVKDLIEMGSKMIPGPGAEFALDQPCSEPKHEHASADSAM
jgi:hypothetical protein